MAAAGFSPSAQVVGNAFVQQYYLVLHQSPELVHRFYQEGSKLGRPDPHGDMDSVTTMQAINERILSAEYSGLRAAIRTVDSQDSLSGGVIVLVTGDVTRADGVVKDFTQTFFLAPQDKGYFVLNDVFRYIGEEGEAAQASRGLANGSVGVTPPSDSPAPEEHVVEREIPPQEDEEVIDEEVYDPPKNTEIPVVEEEAPVEEVINEVSRNPPPVVADPSPPVAKVKAEPSPAAAPAPPTAAPPAAPPVVTEPSPTTVREEAPKKSYASIVKVMRDSPAPLLVPASTPARPQHTNVERHAAPTPAPVPSENAFASSNAYESNNGQESEVDGHSIYVKNLPLSATPAQLEEEFKKFGPIKPDGIQVRIHKLQGFCFGFVEFEVASSVQSAIEASPVMMDGRPAFIAEKRTGSRLNNRGRFPPGRGGVFRNDGVRGRGSYAGSGYGRGGNFNSRPEFGNRGGGRAGLSNRGGEGGGYQRVDHLSSNGGNRGGGRSVAPRVSASA